MRNTTMAIYIDMHDVNITANDNDMNNIDTNVIVEDCADVTYI